MSEGNQIGAVSPELVACAIEDSASFSGAATWPISSTIEAQTSYLDTVSVSSRTIESSNSEHAVCFLPKCVLAIGCSKECASAKASAHAGILSDHVFSYEQLLLPETFPLCWELVSLGKNWHLTYRCPFHEQLLMSIFD